MLRKRPIPENKAHIRATGYSWDDNQGGDQRDEGGSVPPLAPLEVRSETPRYVKLLEDRQMSVRAWAHKISAARVRYQMCLSA